MRKAAFKLGCGLAATAVGEVGGLGKAAANPGRVAFNTTKVDIEDVEEVAFDSNMEMWLAAFQRKKITHVDEVRVAVNELHGLFREALQRGASHPKVKEAVKTYLPTTDGPSLMRFIAEADALLDSIPMKIETNATMEATPGSLGTFNPTTNRISINPAHRANPTKIKYAIMHELMHATGAPLYMNVAGSREETYLRADCAELARKKPEQTLDNANSWYFAISRAVE